MVAPPSLAAAGLRLITCIYLRRKTLYGGAPAASRFQRAGGMVIDSLGYSMVFLLAAGASALSLFIVRLWVPEPAWVKLSAAQALTRSLSRG